MFLPSNITLKFGDSGDFVSELQRRLAAVKCFNADAVNGFFDGVTVNAVSQFQSMSGIRADGIAGPETLRRLNGVISGDTSTTADHKAEEERKSQQLANEQLAQQNLIAEQRALAEPVYQPPVEPVPQHSHAPQLAEVNYAQPQAYEAQQHQHQLAQQQAQQPPQPLQPVAGDLLAQMLLTPQQLGQVPPQHQTAVHHPLPPESHAGQHPAAAHHAGAHQHVAATHTQTAHVIHAAPPAVAPIVPIQPTALAPSEVAPQAVATAEPLRGLVGRAIHYASEKLQQLASHFESRLRPDVIDQVKDAGLALARSGVKEAAIPSGPEPQRGIEGPQRGQQQAQQRG